MKVIYDIKPLTPRQREILDLIKKGLNDTQIGDALCISRNTVIGHINGIRSKLMTHSGVTREQLPAIARSMEVK